MTPAAAVSPPCWQAGPMSASPTCQAIRRRPGSAWSDNLGVILTIDNMGVNPHVCNTELKAMATVPHRKGASRAAISKGEAIADLMLEAAQFFFRLRAVGQKTGLITNWGAGAFGFMRSLALIGPLTVPQIAQTRPTSRQRMQR